MSSEWVNGMWAAAKDLRMTSLRAAWQGCLPSLLEQLRP